MNQKDNFPCFVLCFSCSDKLSEFFVNRKYLARRELFGKQLRQPRVVWKTIASTARMPKIIPQKNPAN